MANDDNGAASGSLREGFQPEMVGRFWQHSATRLVRANERILHGILTAATREVQLVQDLTRYNLKRFNKFADGTSPEQARTESQESYREFETILTGLREVSEELWKTFGDASKLFLEGTLAEARNVASETVYKGAQQAEAVVDRTSESIKDATHSIRNVSETIRE